MDIPPLEIKCSDDITDLAMSKQEAIVAAAIVDGSIEIHSYSTKEDKLIRTLNINECIIRTVTFSQDGKNLFCGCEDGLILLITLEGKELWRCPVEKKHETEISRVFCVDEKSYFSGDMNGIVKLWDPRPGHLSMRMFKQHLDYISDFAYNEKHDCVVIASSDGSLSVINMKDRSMLYQTSTCNDELLSCCIVKGGDYICAGTQEGVVNIYQWNEEEEICDRVTGHPESVDGMVTVDETTIMTGSEDGYLRIIQVMPNQFLGIGGACDNFPVERMEWSFDRAYLGVVSHDSVIRLFDMSILRDDEDDDDEEEEEEEEEEKKEKKDESDSDSDEEDTRKEKQTRKVVPAKNLKRKIVPKKQSNFYDDLYPCFFIINNLSNLHTLGEEIMRNPELSKIHPTSHKE